MFRVSLRFSAALAIFSATLAFPQIKSSYLDLPLSGQWQANEAYAPDGLNAEAYYDSVSGTLVSIRALASVEKMNEISKYFQKSDSAPSAGASQLLSTSEFPLPRPYVEEAARQIANGQKPARLWDVKTGEGNPMWFYSSQLFDGYKTHMAGSASEVTEVYSPARIVRADHQTVPGGEAILLEIETEHGAPDAALKRFHMPAAMKDQKIRYAWVQFMPGGAGSQQGVLSVAMATPANSGLTADELLKEITSAKLKPAE